MANIEQQLHRAFPATTIPLKHFRPDIGHLNISLQARTLPPSTLPLQHGKLLHGLH